MRFGAFRQTDGSATFRLWAPEAETVDLAVFAPGHTELHRDSVRAFFPMQRSGEEPAIFEALLPTTDDGTLYAFRVDGERLVPDPASRFQPAGVHGASALITPEAFPWDNDADEARFWHEHILYELHIGAFTGEGTFDAAAEKLPCLADLGITCVEIMPLAATPDGPNWGYDGVYPFAPDRDYGPPDALKRFIRRAHALDIDVILDVVYNHFGPEGNYLRGLVPEFFQPPGTTPWGDGIRFDGPNSGITRDFILQNALFWLHEYRFDGLRIDAVHAIHDKSEPNILTELADRIRSECIGARPRHLILENDHPVARFADRSGATPEFHFCGQWFHHPQNAMHFLLSGERGHMFDKDRVRAFRQLSELLAKGSTYQVAPEKNRPAVHDIPTPGGHSPFHHTLPLCNFVLFLQNHDQIGNSPDGTRLIDLAPPDSYWLYWSLLVLSPGIPMLFMGEEWGSRQPFPYFCRFGDIAEDEILEGRVREFHFDRFDLDRLPARRPYDPETFHNAKLDWSAAESSAGHDRRVFCRAVISLRRRFLVPLLPHLSPDAGRHIVNADFSSSISWLFDDGTLYTLHINDNPHPVPPASGFTGTAIGAISKGRLLTANEQQAVTQTGTIPAHGLVAEVTRP